MDSNSICNPDRYVWGGQGRSEQLPAKNWTWMEPPSFFRACQSSRQEDKARWADSSAQQAVHLKRNFAQFPGKMEIFYIPFEEELMVS